MTIENIQPHEKLSQFWPLLKLATAGAKSDQLVTVAETLARALFHGLPVRFAAPEANRFVQVELHGFVLSPTDRNLYAEMVYDGTPQRVSVGGRR